MGAIVTVNQMTDLLEFMARREAVEVDWRDRIATSAAAGAVRADELSLDEPSFRH